MRLIDTHSHLFLDDFTEDLTAVIERAQAVGVYKAFMPNVDLETLNDMISVFEKYPGYCYPMIGLHPTSVKGNYQADLQVLEEKIDQYPFIAVGEVGIDLYWDKTFIKEQIDAFRQQIEWSLKYELPIVIHSREAFDVICETMSPYKDQHISGIFHSFTGTAEEATKLLELGDFKLGINGVVTFKNSGLSSALKEIPLEHIVLETDSPYLAPVPYRGKRNESAYLMNVLSRLSDIYGLSPEDVADATTKNALSIFKISE